jgi:hypothetical protein
MTEPHKAFTNRIRSFIRRQGRATLGQKIALESLWDKYCLSPQQDYDFAEVFGRQAPLIVEIGFGNGSSLADMAEANPQLNYLGIEVHRPGVGHLMMLLEQRGIGNSGSQLGWSASVFPRPLAKTPPPQTSHRSPQLCRVTERQITARRVFSCSYRLGTLRQRYAGYFICGCRLEKRQPFRQFLPQTHLPTAHQV